MNDVPILYFACIALIYLVLNIYSTLLACS